MKLNAVMILRLKMKQINNMEELMEFALSLNMICNNTNECPIAHECDHSKSHEHEPDCDVTCEGMPEMESTCIED